jgi:hypothetical protein
MYHKLGVYENSSSSSNFSVKIFRNKGFNDQIVVIVVVLVAVVVVVVVLITNL